MQCHSCGTISPDGTTRCPACGASIQAEGSKSPYELDDEVIPFIEYPQPKAPPIAVSIPVSQGTSAPEQLSTSQQSTFVVPQPDVAQQPQIRQSISAGAAALLVVLAFLLVGGGGFGYYLLKVQPTELSAQATNIVQNILTVQAQSTSNANAQGLADFTTKSPQQMYNQIISRKPDFSDPLTKPDSNFWVNFKEPALSCTFQGSAYHAITSVGFPLCLAQNTDFSNFAYQAHMTLLHGDEGALLFRVDDLYYTFYRFIIGSDGSYSLHVVNHNAYPDAVLNAGYSSVIFTNMKRPEPVALTVTAIAYDSLIYLYVNGQFLASVKDNTIGSGKIGVTAVDNHSPTEVVFSDIQVWTL
jgi:hypothetical protein